MSKFITTLEKKYKICLIHNPRHFYPNRFYIEEESGKKYLMGYSIPFNGKKSQVKKVALLKEKIIPHMTSKPKSEWENMVPPFKVAKHE